MTIQERIAHLREEQARLVQLGLDLSQAAEGAGRSLSEVELRQLSSYRERAEAIGKEIDQLLPLAQSELTHTEEIARLGRGADTGDRGRDERPAGISVTEPLPWRTAGEFVRDYIGGTPNGFNDGRVDSRMAERISAYMQTRAGNQVTGDTPGLLPEPIVGQVMTDVDQSRPFIASIGAKPLGNISGKTFSRPVVAGHVGAGPQSIELSALPGQQMIVNSVDFTKSAAGSAVTISRQDIDWSDPAVWQIILDDMAAGYAEYTDDIASTTFAALVTQTTAAPSDDLDGYITALYQAAYIALTKNGVAKARARRIPNVVWTSPDMWATIGAAIDKARAQARPEITGLGSGGVGTINGSVLDLPRIMVPGLNAGTAIVGRTDWTEFYEQRIGLLQAVKPTVLGVELAVPGFIAYGTLDPTCFCEVTPPGAPLAVSAKGPVKG